MDSTGVGNASGEAKKEPTGQSYNYSDQELIRRLVKSRMAQKQQLEYEDLDGYVLPPRTQFSMLKKPAVTIKYGRMTFNMACIRLFESVQYILPLIHPGKEEADHCHLCGGGERFRSMGKDKKHGWGVGKP